jgi:probable F420-dependent oxidoreductase
VPRRIVYLFIDDKLASVAVQDLGRIGIWSRELRFGEPGDAREGAAELEDHGFGTLWVPGGLDGPLLELCAGQLAATRRVAIATGILNVFGHDPADVARDHARFDSEHPGRFLLGIGVGHTKFLDAEAVARSRRPLAVISEYLDDLDRHAPSCSSPARVVAALAPRMVELARERTLGVHPYMVPVEHTAEVRAALGAGPLVATELSVVLGDDLAELRARARADLALYLQLPNYTRTWRRLGWGEDDLARSGSDRLVDALYALGDVDRIGERLQEHLAAGADHVCLRVVTGAPATGVDERLPRREWRELAALAAS